MKKLIITICLLMTMLGVFVPAIQAQEYIKTIDNLPGDTTLVREYKNDSRVVCSSCLDSTTFVMVSENGSSAPYITILEDIHVSDMEVFGDTLFFCGSIYRNSLIGYVGVIDLSTFPSSTVRLALMYDVNACHRLEVFRACYDSRIHVVATASDQNKIATMLDIMKGPSGWSFYRSVGEITDRVYDDVAATNSYVITTVRGTRDSTGYIYYLDHPTPGNHIFYGTHGEAVVYHNVLSDILVESRYADNFVTMCKNQLMGLISITTQFDVAFYNGTATGFRRTYSSGDIAGFNTNYAIDLKYNGIDNEVDLLVNCRYSGYRNSLIYYIDSTTNTDARLFGNHDIRSLDFLYHDPVSFIASGFGSLGELCFYKYTPHIWNICSKQERIKYGHVKWDLEIELKSTNFITEEPFLSLVIQNSGEKDIINICTPQRPEEE